MAHDSYTLPKMVIKLKKTRVCLLEECICLIKEMRLFIPVILLIHPNHQREQ